jgi:hypothetical protein
VRQLYNAPGLGQREAAEGIWLDKRDALHPVDPYLEGLATATPTKKTWTIGPILDQGSEGVCVGFSGAAFLNCEPIVPDKPRTATHALSLYRRSQQLDEWPGEDYSGTSTRALAKVLVERKWIDGEYLWADSIAKINAWIRAYGPVIFSSRWTDGMYDTDPKGFKWVTGGIVGGHAYLVFGVTEWGTWQCQNSWGYDEGIEGCFYLSPETQRKLMGLGYWSALTTDQLVRR